MSESNPDHELRIYVEVFRIAPKSCPPDYFTLLGLSRDSHDPDAIQAAVQKRSALLNKNLPAELHLPARRVLRQLDRARICLSDPNSRAAYLATLENRSASRATEPTKAKHRTGEDTATTKLKAKAKRSAPARSKPANNDDTTRPSLRRQQTSGNGSKSVNSDGDGFVLDLGPTTHVEIGRKPAESNLPVYILVGVLGLITIGVLVYAISGEGPAETLVVDASAAVASEESIEAIQESGVVTSVEVEQDASAHRSPPVQQSAVDTRSRNVRELPEDGDRSAPSSSLLFPSTRNDESHSDTQATTDSHHEQGPLQPTQRPTAQPTIESVSLADIHEEVILPSLEKHATVNRKDLGKVNRHTLDQLEIQLSQPELPKHENTRFQLEESVDTDGVRQWNISLKATSNKDDANYPEDSTALGGLSVVGDIPVGEIYYQDEALNFRWTNFDQKSHVEQLRNCLLLLNAETESCQVQLRPKKTIGRFVTDLTERNQVFVLEDEAVPAAEAMQLHLQNMNLARAAFELEPSDGLVGHGQTIKVKLLDWQGDTYEAYLELAFTGSSNQPQVRFTPRYRLDRTRSYLTPEDLQRTIGNLKKSLADAESSFQFSQRQARDLPGQITRLASQKNVNNAAQIDAGVVQLQRQLKSAQGTLRRTDKSIPKLRDTIKGLEQLATVARSFDRNGTIEFKVSVPCNHGELVLLSTEENTSSEL